jgi:hypothetical protein
MKVRMTKAERAAGMMAAKTAGMTFAKWANMMTLRHLKRKVEGEVMEAGKLSRENSVSVYVGCKGVSPAIVRRAVAEAIAVDDSLLDWGYHWRKDTLDAVIYVQGALGNVMDYKQAQAFMDGRLEERKQELSDGDRAVARGNKRVAKGAQ